MWLTNVTNVMLLCEQSIDCANYQLKYLLIDTIFNNLAWWTCSSDNINEYVNWKSMSNESYILAELSSCQISIYHTIN